MGGGNTSAKNDRLIWAKASGYDLGSLPSQGLVEMRRSDLQAMIERDRLSDIEMIAGYAAAGTVEGGPPATIEALLHHALPFPSVLHSHADGIVALTDTGHGLDLVTEVLGSSVVAVPYVMPGFALAQLAPRLWREAGGTARALVLQHHGLFTMGDTVDEAMQTHLELVARAEAYFADRGRAVRAPFEQSVTDVRADGQYAQLLTDVEAAAGFSVFAAHCRDAEVRAFLARDDLAEVTQRGPTTLEHVIRTKRVPMLGADVASYARDYMRYFERHARNDRSLIALDPAPRVILDEELGLVTIGHDRTAARAAMDIYRHTIRIIEAAERSGGYRAVSEADAFDIEYWELEQRRLR